MGTSGANHPSFSGDSRDQRSFHWCQLWISECLRVAKPGATMLVFSDWRQLATTIDAVQAGGFTFTGIVPWDKTEGTRPRMGGFRAQAEYIVAATNGKQDQALAHSIGCLPGVFRFPVKKGDKFHQTGKPTALMEALVKVCPADGLVLDPFAGSGTTLVAAVQEGLDSQGHTGVVDHRAGEGGAVNERARPDGGRYYMGSFRLAAALRTAEKVSRSSSVGHRAIGPWPRMRWLQETLNT
jgi:hypothetical protein